VFRDLTREGEPYPPQDGEDWVSWIAEFENGTDGVFKLSKLTKGLGLRKDPDQAELNGTEASLPDQLHHPHQILFSKHGKPYQMPLFQQSS
jgi:hypothetical protein